MVSTGQGAVWEIQQDAFGMKIRHTWPFDITSATVQQIKLKKPDGTVVTKTSTFTAGDPNSHEATIALSDLNQAGTYRAQSYIESTPYNGNSTVYEGFVGRNL